MIDLTGLESIALKFALAVALSGLVGLERQRKARGAGLRTHILVCLGATLLMVCADLLMKDSSGGSIANEKSRLAAGIVTGIGFIGAGTILSVGNELRGLTTAAMIWFVAALGIAIGLGYYMVAACATLFGLAVVVLLEYVERLIPAHRQVNLVVEMPQGGHDLATIKKLIRKKGYRAIVTGIRLADHGKHDTVRLEIRSSEAVPLEELAVFLREHLPMAREIHFKV